MKDKLRFIALPIVLLLIAFVGRLIMGAMGVSYGVANRVFSMVILQMHLALLWGAFAKKYRGYGMGSTFMIGVLIGLVSQILVMGATIASYGLHTQTFFNYPEALESPVPVAFADAMVTRLRGMFFNTLFSGVAAVLGSLLSFLIPPRS